MQKFKYFTIIFFFFFMSFDTIEINTQNDDEYIYDFVDEMPKFPGGEKALKQFIKDHLNYPNRLKKAGVEGKVFVEFVIEKTGELTQHKVYKDDEPKLTKEAIRIVKSMPNWIPGKHKGKVVRVRYTLPIEFKIEK